MEDLSRQVPEGFTDLSADECAIKRTVEAIVREIFLRHGLKEICTPTLEYLDVFRRGGGVLRQEDMFKLTDPQGSILVVKPDMTIPVARMTATQMKTERKPHKLFYVSNILRIKGPGAESQREFSQAGVEFIGIPGAEADGECISIAIEALKDTGIEEFRIDLGQTGLFEYILAEIEMSAEDKECIRGLIKHKNLAAAEEFLNQKGIKGKLKDLLLAMPMLYGNPGEVLQRIRKFPLCEGAVKALYDIEQVYGIVEEYGYGEYISVDLGMVRELPYYSGIIFKGYTRELGYIVCSGGRYDGLPGQFGEDSPATGFAINISRVVQSLYRQNNGNTKKPNIFVLKCVEGNRKKAVKVAQRLRDAGLYIDIDMSGDSIKDTVEYAVAKGAKKVILLHEGNRLKITDPITGVHSITSVPGIIASLSGDWKRRITAWH